MASVMLDRKQSLIREASWTNRNELRHRLRNANVVLLTVDLSKPDDLEILKSRLSEYGEGLTNATPKIIIVATKGDSIESKDRQEYAKKVQALAQQYGYPMVEASSKTGVGVENVLDQMLNPRVVEMPQSTVANKQAKGLMVQKKSEALEVTLSGLNVDAQSAIETFISLNKLVVKDDQLATKLVAGTPQLGIFGKGEKDGEKITIIAGNENTITIKMNFSVHGKKDQEIASEYRKLFAEQLANLVNQLQCGATVTIVSDASKTLKPALEEKLTRAYEPAKKAVVIIHGMEPFLQEFEKKGTAISSFAGGFADNHVADNVSLRNEENGTEKLSAHMVESDSTLSISVAASSEPGLRKVEIMNDQLNGKGLKELVVAVNDMMDRCNAVAARIGTVMSKDSETGEVLRSNPMEKIRFDTAQSTPEIKGAVDSALQRAGFGAQLQPQEEQQEIKRSGPSLG